MSKRNAPVATKTAPTFDTDKKTNNWLLLKVFLVAAVFLLYGKTANYEFTLDDDLFYLKHSSVQKGLDGFSEFFSYGSLNKFDGTTGVQPYRPITLLYFGLQKQYFDNSTTAAHFFNVLLYALVVLVLHLIHLVIGIRQAMICQQREMVECDNYITMQLLIVIYVLKHQKKTIHQIK